jgi:hypothetical protein
VKFDELLNWGEPMRIGPIIATAAGMAFAASSFSVSDARADVYPFCAVAGGNPGYQNCDYPSFGACMAAVSGVGGFCQANPRFVGYRDPDDSRPVRRRSRSDPARRQPNW